MTSARIMAWCSLIVVLVITGVFDGELVRVLKSDRGEAAWVDWIGYWLGHGLVQVIVLGGIGLLAWKLGRQRLRLAMFHGLLAFLLSGIFVHLFKGLIGRPRPRLWEKGVVNFGPSLADGLDSFPSGHTATSMAVAMVLSYYYPRCAPLFMAGAAFVAAARVLGGAHFPLDVLGGTILGLAVGWFVITYIRKPMRPAPSPGSGQ